MPVRKADLSGRKFGRLRVLGRASCESTSRWDCLCKCGNKTVVKRYKLLTGHTRSCGCLVADAARRMGKAMRTHGHAIVDSPEYRVWRSVLYRSRAKTSKDFQRYGHLGLSKRWAKFENFLADMGPRPSLEHSIDRIDNSKGYYPGNTRWATRSEQATNKSSNRWITIGSETKTLSQWATQSNLSMPALRARLRLGWSPAEAVSRAKQKATTIAINGVAKTYAEWSQHLGLSRTALYSRIRSGWSPEMAASAKRSPSRMSAANKHGKKPKSKVGVQRS